MNLIPRILPEVHHLNRITKVSFYDAKIEIKIKYNHYQNGQHKEKKKKERKTEMENTLPAMY